jgi:hypothetical protein
MVLVVQEMMISDEEDAPRIMAQHASGIEKKKNDRYLVDCIRVHEEGEKHPYALKGRLCKTCIIGVNKVWILMFMMLFMKCVCDFLMKYDMGNVKPYIVRKNGKNDQVHSIYGPGVKKSLQNVEPNVKYCCRR